MARTFVAIDDPLHHLLRDLTRRTPLVCSGLAEGVPVMQYRVRPETVPEPYYTVALCHGLAGSPLSAAGLPRWKFWPPSREAILERAGYFDAVRLDRRCCRDLRLQLGSIRPGMVALELLAFGAGTLRARNDNPAEPVHQYLRRRYGGLRSRREIVFSRLRTLHRNSLVESDDLQKESYESTNVIYGDAIGEVEQLWERRADTSFLDQVAHSLQRLRRRARLVGFVHPPLHLAALLELHLRAQAFWKSPPASGRALLRRVEFILEHTVLDRSPRTLIESVERPAPTPPPRRQFKSPEWPRDHSGYDGLLGSDI